jgi:hypothetical protein
MNVATKGGRHNNSPHGGGRSRGSCSGFGGGSRGGRGGACSQGNF